MRILTLGTFDLLHSGHRRLFQRAAEFGPLFVGVNSDEFTHSYKGRYPLHSQDERMRHVKSSRHVRGALLNDGPGRESIIAVAPSMIVVGSDWLERDYLAQIGVRREWLDERDIALLFLPRTPGISTTQLRAVA